MTPAELAQIMKTEEPEAVDELIDERESQDEPSGYLDKAWDGIQYLLDGAGLGIDLRFDGDFIDEEATLFGWSAELVARTAQKLRAAPFEQLVPHFDPARMTARDVYPASLWNGNGALDYLREHYQDLVRFFDAAASSGSAAVMRFG